MPDIPERIYLQVHCDECGGECEDIQWDEITISQHRVYSGDIEYVRVKKDKTDAPAT